MTDEANFGLMYTTCMFCHKPLGSNEIIEHFPVGRRLAFDAAKGRLWVVCRACERWNLTPLETRWEAVEECERTFVATRLRVSTDNIGLARLSEGLELVRIGEPRRPEFAAWRHGDQFGRRRARSIMIGGGVAMAAGAVMVGAAAAGIGIASLGGFWGNIPNIYMALRHRVRIRTDDGRILKLRYGPVNAAELTYSPHSSFAIRVKGETFVGAEALRIARRIVPVINSSGGSGRTIQAAVRELERSGSADAFLGNAVRSPVRRAPWPIEDFFQLAPREVTPIAKWPAVSRLAFEMALHEDLERQAIEGELSALEAAWREAEEIAAIADNMFTPAEIENKLERMKESSPD